ncbi:MULTISPECIES: DUF2750 domain-containing protein [unclassified Chryseobacterium]|uniref:DUF2750 domain-containing protein n=1 Tax=unclassified Chryseobacterium TaxID=2593645 RepID=UPI0030172118
MNQKQIENILKLEPQKRYEYFIRKVADFEELWTIVDENGDYALSSVDDKTLVSFWSAEEFIGSNLDDEWSNCKTLKLSLDDLTDEVLPYIADNDYLMNIFPINGRSGFIVDLEEFSRDFTEELKKYE